MYPHLNIPNLSTRSHPSEEENRSKNCKDKVAIILAFDFWINAWWYILTKFCV
jgi:hypothetical protein